MGEWGIWKKIIKEIQVYGRVGEAALTFSQEQSGITSQMQNNHPE